MIWTNDELALAIRLVSKLGYPVSEAAVIMTRHGFPPREPSQIEEKLKADAPKAWRAAGNAFKMRNREILCGVAVPKPARRMQKINKDLVLFLSRLSDPLTDDQACWIARENGFNCNLTDINLAARHAGFVFKVPELKSISYDKAIEDDLCLWPVNDGACGKDREVGRYCGPHSCRALGGTIK